jgi:hypothetical protein
MKYKYFSSKSIVNDTFVMFLYSVHVSSFEMT